MSVSRPDARPRPRLWHDISAAAISAGVLSFVISLSGPVVIYWQAAQSMGLDVEAFVVWVFAIFTSAGLTTFGLSLWFRVPVLTAWSAPGTILLVAVGPSLSMGEIVGAYILVGVALIVTGISGVFERIVSFVPKAVASGMLAGILFQFIASALLGVQEAPLIILVLPVVFILLHTRVPHLAIFGVLVTALALVWVTYGLDRSDMQSVSLSMTWTSPTFSMTALLSLALPLLITTLTGQFMAGMTVLRSQGFPTPMRTILVTTGLMSLPAALLGGITTALASITMAIGAGEEVDPDPSKRYVAGVVSGVVFLLGAASVGVLIAVMTALPAAFVALVGGLALLGPICKAFNDMLYDRKDVMAGVLTFLVASSGLSFAGIGAAFWSVIAGVVAVRLLEYGRP